MSDNKEVRTKFLDLLMYKFHTDGNIVTDKQRVSVITSFRLQMQWNKTRSNLPKKLKKLL